MEERTFKVFVAGFAVVMGGAALWFLWDSSRTMKQLQTDEASRFLSLVDRPPTFIHSTDWKQVHEHTRDADPAPGYLPMGYALCPLCWPEYDGWTPHEQGALT